MIPTVGVMVTTKETGLAALIQKLKVWMWVKQCRAQHNKTVNALKKTKQENKK